MSFRQSSSYRKPLRKNLGLFEYLYAPANSLIQSEAHLLQYIWLQMYVEANAARKIRFRISYTPFRKINSPDRSLLHEIVIDFNLFITFMIDKTAPAYQIVLDIDG